MIVIIDYGIGNVGSIKNMLSKLGANAVITSKNEIILRAEKIILPGVGKFDAGINGIKSRNLFDVLNKRVIKDKIPVLGICLGMQLMTKGSEEGKEAGFGWIDAFTYKFTLPKNLKVPHMGWNSVNVSRENALTSSLNVLSKFYFVHSYYVKTMNVEDTFIETEYGLRFAAGIARDNIYGVQFHPEKSHRYGMELLKSFVNI